MNRLNIHNRTQIPFYKAFRLSVSTGKEIYSNLEFTHFARIASKTFPNIEGTDIPGMPSCAQNLYPNWRVELWNIWKFFGEEKAKQVGSILFGRKILEKINDTYGVGMNINSKDFFRDTNISFSIYDTNTQKEIGIIGVYIDSEGVVEVMQIQWKEKEGASLELMGSLMEKVKKILKELGFKKIVILSSEKNYLTIKPNAPMFFASTEEENLWLQAHKTRMKLTYDVTPIRKWGFTKPSNKNQFYSAEYIL